ncbi:inter-alpha-trypsin inhibitor heavy chain H3-like [Daktulosphaira vitifoliae]|uniref:inter-alpha-trypsin inhibitor heavy chain H3-like n=1 Tax=Daktulosphaira vitifoliae TaxID=58002 RepID=UPI0021AAC1B6|nr:inter-alpha-trypsin inhibitor heavy chain H3-like [Daktulosphaira vitifoliae]XP_050533849.1 inter-alpha-trypsin inhibitor heavy chain H3-like [Daktulosphaira vitifoliae]
MINFYYFISITLILFPYSILAEDFTNCILERCQCALIDTELNANCANINLTKIPEKLDNDVKALDLSRNLLYDLKKDAFKSVGLINLRKLVTRDCHINYIDKYAFSGLSDLTEVDLSHNSIGYLPENLFNHTTNLRKLNVSHNYIGALQGDLFNIKNSLETIDFSYCEISFIDPIIFANAKSLKNLYLNHNKFSNINPNFLKELPNLELLHLNDNPWFCNCELRPFRELILTSSLYNNLTCSNPSKFENKLWQDIKLEDFACVPNIEYPLQDLTYEVHTEESTIRCKANGGPIHSLYWKLNNKTISNSSHDGYNFTIYEGSENITHKWVNLTIPQSAVNEKLEFKCVVENPAGKDERTIIVQKPTRGDIYSFIVHSKIRHRYAQTTISSRVANKGNTSQEVQFFVTLPESAFISKFLMEVNEKVYEAYVKEKKEARQDYINAINAGQTAAHVEQNARDSNQFTVSLNVEAEHKVTFNLTYDQLLLRKLGVYPNVININPGQVVKKLMVIVDIEEASNITTLEVPDLKTTNEIETMASKNKMAKITRTSSNSSTITWSPSIKEQIASSDQGINGQFIVEYDVDHESTPNQILIDDGYFVHYFSPADMKPLRTHVLFVLDVSGSMEGQKLVQMKEAMEQILTEILPEDYFTIILFSDFAQVWTLNATQETSNRWDQQTQSMKNNTLQNLSEGRFVFPANPENIENAKKFVRKLISESSTNIEDALKKALDVAKMGDIKFTNGPKKPKPIVVFLTDGQPNTGISQPDELTNFTTHLNTEKYPIFSLGFGEGVDIEFLKELSLKNFGFARTIYEASDASLQLKNFYREISSPVLSNVTFKYVDSQVDNITVTKKSFNLLFSGTEIIVAGVLRNSSETLNGTLYADSINGEFIDSNVVICDLLPLQYINETITKPVGHLEKLWAFLHIQQLIDQHKLEKNENSTAKTKALELALKYSFVTPFTSLVVVKPNETTSSDPQKIKPTSAQNNLILSSPMHQSFIKPLIVSGGFAGPPSYSMASWSSANMANGGSAKYPSTPGLLYFDALANNETTTINNSIKFYSLNDLTWMNLTDNVQPNIILSSTNVTYQVSLNSTNQSYQNCTTQENILGSCKHLKDCTVASILNSFEMYLSLFCSIENMYAGICCTI